MSHIQIYGESLADSDLVGECLGWLVLGQVAHGSDPELYWVFRLLTYRYLCGDQAVVEWIDSDD